ncbi:membrane protein [Streptomyces sp. NRRL B-1140]|uniref:hypothetical protein n=1 Tax=Streptomyces sp. NRRL B-1140 TaxID=1415549 RepID=UPI0006AF7246|nr:hypothetical protein [Streptomyces sp. NRRL B-1140]KOV99838.1 membrane protein [Streptomyces sp. NRRL B-1140]
MPGLVDLLLIALVAVVVTVRQFRARPIDSERRWRLLPGLLVVLALREPGMIDAHHPTASALLLGAELLVGLATGAGWAWTTRIWAEPDGTVWSRSGTASVAVWAVGIGLRTGLFALGTAVGVHQDSSALLLGFAGTLLVRAGILAGRGQSARRGATLSRAYGDGKTRPRGRERV